MGKRTLKDYIFRCACTRTEDCDEENTEYIDQGWNAYDSTLNVERKKKKRRGKREKSEHFKVNKSDDETVNSDIDEAAGVLT